MNDQKKSSVFPIIGMILLVAVLCVCLKGVFALLDASIPQSAQPDSTQSQSAQSPDPADVDGSDDKIQPPSFCPFCGEGLPSTFRWGQFCPWCGEKVEN